MSPVPAPYQHIWLGEVIPRPGFLRRWEYTRHHRLHHLIECLSEAMGVFFYVWFGVGSTVSFVINNIGQQPGLGSLLQIGAAYGIGIVIALCVCAGTSGHINPCVTIAFAVYRGFPWKKVPTFIVSQILGAYIACLTIYLQYKDAIKGLEQALLAEGKFASLMFTPNGPAGAFALYANPGKPLGLIFWNEFVSCFVLALVIWAFLDPTNFIASPTSGAWIVGLAYSACIWGYVPANIALNTARDVGARLFALTIWGTQASGGTYAAIAALTNIPATLLAILVYEFIFYDSSRVVAPGHYEQLLAHKAHLDRRFGASQSDYYNQPKVATLETGHGHQNGSQDSTDDKARVEMRE